MGTSSVAEITRTLIAIGNGDRVAAERLMPLVYDRFRSLAAGYMRRQPSGHTLRPTELVHEAYLKLVDREGSDWRSRSHFLAVGGMAMRQILVDHAKYKNRQKRGGGFERITLVEDKILSPRKSLDVLSIHEALDKLAELNKRQAKMIEMRFFGGLSVEEVAEVMGISERSVRREWVACRAWLRKELSSPKSP